MKRQLALGLVFLALLSCGDNPSVTDQAPIALTGGTTTTSAAPTVASIGVTPAGPFTLSVGQTTQLTGTPLDSSNKTVTGVTLIWASSNPSIATVSSTGLVTAVAPGGPINITASSGTITGNVVSVTVSCAGIPSNSPTPLAVTLNPPSPVSVNATVAVSAVVKDCNGNPVPDNTIVAFSLSPASLGTVSPSSAPTAGGGGVSTALFIAGTTAGNVTVTATAGTVANSATISILALPAGSIKFDKADPKVIGVKNAGQVEVSAITFEVRDFQGNIVADGSVTVRLEFLSGFNPGGGAILDPIKSSTVKGIAKTFLKSGLVAGPVRVLAYIDKDDDGVRDPDEIFTTSTPVSIGGGVPSMRFFSVSADKHNLAGLAFDGEQAKITVRLADRFGNFNVLENTSVSFYTEAGAIDRQALTDATGVATTTLRTQNRPPFDTDPRQQPNPIGGEVLLYNNLNSDDRDSGEPFDDENGSGIVVTMGSNLKLDTTPASDDVTAGRVILSGANNTADTTAAAGDVQVRTSGSAATGYNVGEPFLDLDGGGYDFFEPNPRDGWVTVLAVTQGEETFYDLNGNGLYDAGEAFDDNGGEPFIDENDNGMYDNKETFTDLNANNSYDPGEPFLDKGRGEPFLDSNKNGVRDSGEPFTDLDGDLTYDGPGDSYFDANSNGVRDVGETCVDGNNNGTTCETGSGFYNRVYDRGEFYVDVNGDGTWTHGNGQWDSNASLWVDLRRPGQTEKTSQVIAFTGPPHFTTSRIFIDLEHRDPNATGNYYVFNGGDCAFFTVYVADINNNALIPGTTIAAAVKGAGSLEGLSSVKVGDNSGGGPTILSYAVCDVSSDQSKPVSSSLGITVTWKPGGATDPIAFLMSVSGTVEDGK